jgi:Pyruvate/2-oxoacid:ferredoxin oxidoreductase delta subunit
MKNTRQIIRIDEEKCDGCGQCASACAEGAIQIFDGKAKLVKESYCDGLGACIGDCPRGAIELVERPAMPFDPQEVLKHHLEQDRRAREAAEREQHAETAEANAGSGPSKLTNWPVQLTLVPVHSPSFEGAKILVAGDCTPFAYRDFHETFMEGRTVLVGCPKHEDAKLYREKLARLFQAMDIESVEVVIMEVPCCRGLENVVRQALAEAGKKFKVTVNTISVRGELLGQTESPMTGCGCKSNSCGNIG